MNIIVIGAGLAGAAVSHALAQRGCQVTVLDAAASADNSAPSSNLPAALMAPHHGAASNPITQLSRLGTAATLQAAQTLLVQGQDWQPCGALQRAGKLGPEARWFGDAAWIKPAALVAAWLAHPRIALRNRAQVTSLHQDAATVRWQAKDSHHNVIGQADAVVLANAFGALALLAALRGADGSALLPPFDHSQAPHRPLHQVAGQVAFGPWTPQWQALWPQLLPELASHTNPSQICAINGNGHFIPAIPWQGQPIWLSGSTYEHEAPHAPQITAQGIASNLQRLQQLIPAAADLLAAQHQAGLIQGWAGTRCTTRDRLPIVGAVSQAHAPGLYVCAAMGSRGLSFAALCGQHLAAQVLGTTHDLIDSSLSHSIHPARFA